MFLQTGLFFLISLSGDVLAVDGASSAKPAPAVSVKKAVLAVTTKESSVKPAVKKTAAVPAVSEAKSDIVLTLNPSPPAPAQTAAAALAPLALPPAGAVAAQQTSQAPVYQTTAGAKFPPAATAAPVTTSALWRKVHQKGYFVFHFTNKFFAYEDFEFDGRSVSLGLGAQFRRRGELELYINAGRTTPSFGLKFSHSFVGEGETWIPGADGSLLLGLVDERDREFRELLAVGAGAALFLKTFVSDKYALIARGGVSFAVPVSGSLWDEFPKIDLSLGFKRYFN